MFIGSEDLRLERRVHLVAVPSSLRPLRSSSACLKPKKRACLAYADSPFFGDFMNLLRDICNLLDSFDEVTASCFYAYV